MTTAAQEQAKDETKNAHNAHWHTWATDFLKLPTEPMSKEISHVFLTCCINDGDDSFPPDEAKQTFQYRVVSKRADYAGLLATTAVLAFLSALCKSPGSLVMYVYALRYHQLIKGCGDEVLDMYRLAGIFPVGFPTEESLHKAWEAQKTKNAFLGNMLDSITTKTLGG